MGKVSQTPEELLGQIVYQVQFLQNSGTLYDNGFEAEAIRLAGIIRVLVHDTKNSPSLLRSLDMKDIDFWDTASDFNPNVQPPPMCLIMFHAVNEKVTYSPKLDKFPPNRNKKTPFHEWWDKKIVISDIHRNTFTRKDLVLNVANTDGGAHVDPKLNSAYADLSRFNSLGWKTGEQGGAYFDLNLMANNSNLSRPDSPERMEGLENSPVYASIRQIAYEVEKTLKDTFPHLF